LDEARYSGCVAMAYVRLMVHIPDAALNMVFPGPVHALRENAGMLPRAMLDAEMDYLRSVNRGTVLDMWDPPSPTEGGSDSEDGTDDDA
jgi:hypothetical protein